MQLLFEWYILFPSTKIGHNHKVTIRSLQVTYNTLNSSYATWHVSGPAASRCMKCTEVHGKPDLEGTAVISRAAEESSAQAQPPEGEEAVRDPLKHPCSEVEAFPEEERRRQGAAAPAPEEA